MDRKVGELYVFLQRKGALDNTYLIIFSDHGELSGKNRIYTHILSLHNRLLHVPLLIIPPMGQEWNQEISKPFRLQDLRSIIFHLAEGQPEKALEYIDNYPESQLIYAEYQGNQNELSEEDLKIIGDTTRLNDSIFT